MQGESGGGMPSGGHLPYRSALMINKNMDDVNWVIDVLTIYALHMPLPNVHSPEYMVIIKNGIPMRKHSSAMAKFRIYILVTVCILEKRSTT